MDTQRLSIELAQRSAAGRIRTHTEQLGGSRQAPERREEGEPPMREPEA